MKNKVLLIILDGWGLSPEEKGNAPLLAETPVLNYIYTTYPKISLSASGLEVGLHPGEAGNSEVGHTNIGSGRVVWEDLPRIDQAITEGDFSRNDVFLETIDHAKKYNSTLHLLGLVSDGGVHSHIGHLLALINLAAKKEVKNLAVHFIADGRDTDQKQALFFAKVVEDQLKRSRIGHIATLIGRYFAMDRDTNWARSRRAYDLYLENSGQNFKTVDEAIESSYKSGKTDEFFEPMVIGAGGRIDQNDGLIVFNFRPDRPGQILELLTTNGDKPFKHANPFNLSICTMKRYFLDQSPKAAFADQNTKNSLAEVLSLQNINQCHIAETEKYAHVTYFFDNGTQKPYPGEKQILVPSKKVATYDMQPEMSAPEISQKVCQALKSDYDFIVVNYANGDMVGHSGKLKAAIIACEAVDQALGKILGQASESGFEALITADHGNCEVMLSNDNGTEKQHNNSPVPFVYLNFATTPFSPVPVDFSRKEYGQFAALPPVGLLADVAPTVLAIMKINQPPEMTGANLLPTLS